MSASPTKRINLWMPILFSIVLMLGMYLGFKLNNSASFKRSITSIIQNNRVEEIIALINNRYVDPIDEEELYRDGINGIMNNLDPHTYYIPTENVNATNEHLKGNYKGIGLEYSIEKDTLIVISIVQNGPAAKAGIQLGDKVITINNELVAKSNRSMDEIRSILKSNNSDSVLMEVMPFGHTALQKRWLVRENIHVNSIDAAYELAPTIGYIRIGNFSENTYTEFKNALVQLKPNQLNGLVLDLRQNSGGYLDVAIQILDELFEEGKLLLTINGKSFVKDEYIATSGGLYEQGKLIVLIDETTASSSEIIAGAVQDWDRGVVIGRNSFGKGLVQEQFNLSDGSALRLTIARYYTPTGRSIQRDYSKGKDLYEKENDARLNTLQNWDAQQHAEEQYKTLVSGRVIYANEGIVPDINVRYKDYMLSPNLWHVANGVEMFVNEYFVKNMSSFLTYQSFSDFNQKFDISPSILQAYKWSINEAFTNNVQSVWSNPQKIDFLKQLMKAHFARLLFRNEGYYKVLNVKNEMIEKSLALFSHTSEYQHILKLVN